MKQVKKLVPFALAAILCITVGITIGIRQGKAEQPKITEDLISSRIEEIGELSSLEYHYTKVGKYEDRIDFYGWQVPLTMKRFIISYDGVIRAGVDLEQAEIAVQKDGSVTVTLPKAEILSHEQDLNSIMVFDETKNIFNPIQITDYIEFSKDQKETAEQEAVEKGLLVQAQERAETVVTEWMETLLNTAGATPEITIHSQEMQNAE